MSTLAIRGQAHNGIIKPLEPLPTQDDADVMILFLTPQKDDADNAWDNAVAHDFLAGYSQEDAIYDEVPVS